PAVALSPQETQRLLHELRVHQIELEMQNDELRRTQFEWGLARARYFDLYDLAPVGYCTLDEQGLIREANLTSATLLGVPRAALVQQPIQRFIAKADQDNYYLHCKRLIEIGQAQACELSMVKHDGTSFWAHLESTATQDAKGRREFRVIISDASERQRNQAELVAARHSAEKADNAKSRFLAAASHDLRQPLAAMSIYGNLLKSHVTESGQPLLANLNACIGSLGDLLNDLLDLSKLEAGVVTPKLADFALADVLASLSSVHAPECQLKGLRLRCVPTTVVARSDPVLFKRLLGNLIANAVRYTERGGVLVGCRRRQGKTWVEVWDSGIGIAADKTTEIFEEFKQLADDGRTRGSGLGLAIVAKTATLLGLAIRVRSWPNRGSVFAVEVPPGQQAEIQATAPRETAARPLRIALVEDNTQVREALLLGLTSAGHQVIAAATGSQLQSELDGIAPDIVVSDYRLAHGETGFDVIAALRARSGPDLPALLITGDTDAGLIRSMAASGIVYLHKPVDLETLQAYLEDLTYRD
ncbi:MAG TPA: ATP-binding protein, partial [Rhodocyclaceae bacterium]|nr:ATP-binding protein [Rhodocyclaceae bacterium]